MWVKDGKLKEEAFQLSRLSSQSPSLPDSARSLSERQCCIFWFVVPLLSHVLTLWWPTYCTTPDFPVLHYLPKFAQTHVHWVGDAIHPSHPLSPPSPALNLSQHQSFPMSWPFASGGQSIGASVSVLPMNIQGWFLFGLTGLCFSKTILLVMFQLYYLLPCNTCVCVFLSLNQPRF